MREVRLGWFCWLLVVAAAGCGEVSPGDDAAHDTAADDGGADLPDDVVDDGTTDLPPDLPTDVPADVPADVPTDVPADVPADDGSDVPPPRCGPFPGGTCPADMACDIRSCGMGASGTCVTLPDPCPDGEDPVCGCDGETYKNDCLRLEAGVGLLHTGECGGGTMCGGFAGFPCAAGEVCDIRECFPDAAGRCVPAPGMICPDIWAPQCGCDGRTYSNECERLSVGAAWSHDGECGGGGCVPICAGDPGSSVWADPCTGEPICSATCGPCRVECDFVGTRSEGWYARCGGPVAGGCDGSGDLIAWADCG